MSMCFIFGCICFHREPSDVDYLRAIREVVITCLSISKETTDKTQSAIALPVVCFMRFSQNAIQKKELKHIMSITLGFLYF